MNILVIGNGFDLAHELNTQYKEFLEVIDIFNDTAEKVRINGISHLLKNIKGKK